MIIYWAIMIIHLFWSLIILQIILVIINIFQMIVW